MSFVTRKFQRNAFTQYALEQLSEEEKEMMLRSESLKAFMNSVTPRLNNAIVHSVCLLLPWRAQKAPEA